MYGPVAKLIVYKTITIFLKLGTVVFKISRVKPPIQTYPQYKLCVNTVYLFFIENEHILEPDLCKPSRTARWREEGLITD